MVVVGFGDASWKAKEDKKVVVRVCERAGSNGQVSECWPAREMLGCFLTANGRG
jgi:hypothetical protein